MKDVSAGQAVSEAANGVDQDRLFLLYVIYNAKLVRHLRARLGGRWELAEDLAQDTWEIVTRKLHTCRASDDAAFPWILTVARTATAAHFRRARTRYDMPTDLTGDGAGALLPAAPAAEDEALANVTVLAMLSEQAAPLGVVA